MPFEYVDAQTAINADGLRMMVIGGIPSQWSEAAKGVFHVKNIDWLAVRLDYRDRDLSAWAGERSAPVAVYDNEPPRSRWSDILALAERLAPDTPLMPQTGLERALAWGLAHEICGEGGLGWQRRLQAVHDGLNGGVGFPLQVAEYLGKKYGYSPEHGEVASARCATILNTLSGQLKNQADKGSQFFIGDALTAIDIYSATAMSFFEPMPQDVCKMDDATRAAFAAKPDEIKETLDPALLAHRDFIYQTYLELPLSL